MHLQSWVGPRMDADTASEQQSQSKQKWQKNGAQQQRHIACKYKNEHDDRRDNQEDGEAADDPPDTQEWQQERVEDRKPNEQNNE